MYGKEVMNMRYHNIETNNMENGYGLRVLVWISGCFHNCDECQNPITHDPNDGLEFGEEETWEVIDKLKPDYINGVTFTGGDPLCYSAQDVNRLIYRIQNLFGDSKTIWIYTGFKFEDLLKKALVNHKETKDIIDSGSIARILNHIDVLCDGKYEKDHASKGYHYVGSTNQRVIDVKKTLEEERIVFLEPDQEQYCTAKKMDDDELKDMIRKFKEL
jgi:anaerobic ribonucleoside-triphosphate reductase activating protein